MRRVEREFFNLDGAIEAVKAAELLELDWELKKEIRLYIGSPLTCFVLTIWEPEKDEAKEGEKAPDAV